MKNFQGPKFKGQGHKVTRRGNTKTSNIPRKRHSVVEMRLPYRKLNRLRQNVLLLTSISILWRCAAKVIAHFCCF